MQCSSLQKTIITLFLKRQTHSIKRILPMRRKNSRPSKYYTLLPIILKSPLFCKIPNRWSPKTLWIHNILPHLTPTHTSSPPFPFQWIAAPLISSFVQECLSLTISFPTLLATHPIIPITISHIFTPKSVLESALSPLFTYFTVSQAIFSNFSSTPSLFIQISFLYLFTFLQIPCYGILP